MARVVAIIVIIRVMVKVVGVRVPFKIRITVWV